MAYSVDTRKMVIAYLNKGHTEEDAQRELGVSKSSMTNWRRKLRETGSLENKELQRKPRKLDNDKLKAYIAEHPDTYFTEIAERFNCTGEDVRKVCKRLGITRKKKTKIYRERNEEKREEYLEAIKDISP